MKMYAVALTFGVLLVLLGLYGYFAYSAVMALSASGLGVMLLICGGMARKDEWRMHAMHGAALVGVLGFLGGVGEWRKLPALFSGEPLARPHETALCSIMAALSLIFLVLCIKSFIDARVARKAA